MVWLHFLKDEEIQLSLVLEKVKLSKEEIELLTVFQYPDELLIALSKVTKTDVSRLLFQLLELENQATIRKVQTDYSLSIAIENSVTYIFIPQVFRKEHSRFMTEILLTKDIFELEHIPLARYNLFGREIYKRFLSSQEKSESFKWVEKKLDQYFVLVHDKSGTILCHHSFQKNSEKFR